MRPASRAPIVTAGLTWLPDTGPIRYTSASSVSPNASAVATTPAATLAPANLKPNISVATPTAKNTKIAVPRNSTANFRITLTSPSCVPCGRSSVVRPRGRRYCAGPGTSGQPDRPRDQLGQDMDWAVVSMPDCQGPLLSRELEGGSCPLRALCPFRSFLGGGRLVRGELMVDQQRLTPLREGPPLVTSCWMCGIRLSADHMVADGGSACDDIRWYCQDTRACTE